ncbi:MAG: DUF4386 family protein [Anaerolineae bacterium]|nr:DUF4386 family protein [Anaerolineae bacterium]
MNIETSKEIKGLYRIGGIAAALQLVVILGYAVVAGVLGAKPPNAEAYFAVYLESPAAAFLRGDFLLLILIGLYLGTFPALYAALRRESPVYAALATLFTIMAVTGTIATESTFALHHLGSQFVTASEAQRSLLIAAAEAVIAADMWNSSAAYTGGILLQGSGVMISAIMLRSKNFSKVTAYAGLLGNGFDLIQHLLHPFAPSISAPIQMFMGIFYLVWFPMLARDFFRLAQGQK